MGWNPDWVYQMFVSFVEVPISSLPVCEKRSVTEWDYYHKVDDRYLKMHTLQHDVNLYYDLYECLIRIT